MKYPRYVKGKIVGFVKKGGTPKTRHGLPYWQSIIKESQ